MKVYYAHSISIYNTKQEERVYNSIMEERINQRIWEK